MKVRISQIERWNTTKEMDRRAKAEERAWRKGLKKKQEEEAEKAAFFDGWELQEIRLRPHGLSCMIYRSAEYEGPRGEPMGADEDVGF